MWHQKFLYILVLASFLSLYPHENVPHIAITNGIEEWRRLGDCILTYCKTQYWAQRHNIPFFLTSFTYSDEFQLHFEETVLTNEIKKKFSKIVLINKEEDIQLTVTEPTLYVCHFLSPNPPEKHIIPYIKENPAFEAHLKSMLTPIHPISPLPKPENVITVAVHVRKGGGYDKPLASLQEYKEPKSFHGFYLTRHSAAGNFTNIWPLEGKPGSHYSEQTQDMIFKKTHYSDYMWPVKFPPDQYYLDQIKYISAQLPEKNILIYLFTDDPCPESIVHRYMYALKKHPNIIFSYRKTDNSPTKHVLEDLFHMAACDCLISANSSFAQAAQIVGNHVVTIFPAHATTFPDKIFINKVGVYSRKYTSNQKKTFELHIINRKIQ